MNSNLSIELELRFDLMATTLRPILGRTLLQRSYTYNPNLTRCHKQRPRGFQTSIPQSKIPDFGFAFEYDMQPPETVHNNH